MHHLAQIALAGMITIPAGSYQPLFTGNGKRERRAVATFQLDEKPVTNAQFRDFLLDSPSWRRSKVTREEAEPGYLSGWKDDVTVPTGREAAPVTEVSWFAAAAYCQAHGKRLPTVDEWELVTASSIGVRDAGAPQWEWTLDFESSGVGADMSRFSCGAGSAGSVDARDYDAFMRYAMRASLKANYTVRSLGFRCALGDTASAFAGQSLFDIDATWLNQDGRKIDLAEFAGSTLVVAPIYTGCASVCPMTVSALQSLQRSLSEVARAKVRFVLVSLDPERDDPETLKAFATARGLDSESWTLLTGNKGDLRKLMGALSYHFSKTDEGALVHDGAVFVVNRDGVVVQRADNSRLSASELMPVLNTLNPESSEVIASQKR